MTGNDPEKPPSVRDGRAAPAGRFTHSLARLDASVEQSRRAREAAQKALEAALAWGSSSSGDEDQRAPDPYGATGQEIDVEDGDGPTIAASAGDASRTTDLESPTASEAGQADAEPRLREVLYRLVGATRTRSQPPDDQMKRESLMLIEEASAELVQIAGQIANQLQVNAEKEGPVSPEERVDVVAREAEAIEPRLIGEAPPKIDAVAAGKEADRYQSKVRAAADEDAQKVIDEAHEQARKSQETARKVRERAENETEDEAAKILQAVMSEAEELKVQLLIEAGADARKEAAELTRIALKTAEDDAAEIRRTAQAAGARMLDEVKRRVKTLIGDARRVAEDEALKTHKRAVDDAARKHAKIFHNARVDAEQTAANIGNRAARQAELLIADGQAEAIRSSQKLLSDARDRAERIVADASGDVRALIARATAEKTEARRIADNTVEEAEKGARRAATAAAVETDRILNEARQAAEALKRRTADEVEAILAQAKNLDPANHG